MNESTDTPEILTRLQVSKLLKISLMTLFTWTRDGFLTAYRIGDRHVFYRYSEIMESLKKINYNKK